MGIKGLSVILKKYFDCKHVAVVPSTCFSGKTLAVDAASIVYPSKVKGHSYVESLVEFVTYLRERQILSIFVFDGVKPPEKDKERQRRASASKQQHDRVDVLEEALSEYQKTGTIHTELIGINDNLNRDRKLVQSNFDFQGVKRYVDKLRSHIIQVTDEDYYCLQRVLKIFGIPYVTAPSEAEMYCSKLVRHGLADAVYTVDSDALACLADRVVKGVRGDNFLVIDLNFILETLAITGEMWRDLCIMCGTDFNDNVAKIGPIKSLDLIRKYKSLEAISDVIDTSVLNYARTREIFECADGSLEDISTTFGQVDIAALSEWISAAKLHVSLPHIRRRLNV